ncbi:MAG: hypothetical protein AAGU19_11975 [Prolixibacteraceae bacterium]
MNCATISADIISSTALSAGEKKLLRSRIEELIGELTAKYGDSQFLGRIVQGDYIELALLSPVPALRVALILKTVIKSLDLPGIDTTDKRIRYFKEYGVRLAVAAAPLTTLDPKEGIIDGEAIYLSGRAIKNMSTSGKQKIVIKSTMFFRSPDEEEQEKFDTIFSLLDKIIAGCSGKQCEILYYKLSGFSEKEISRKLNKNQSTISQHSTAAGWQAIEKAVAYFENQIRSA